MEFKNFNYEVSATFHLTREEAQLIFDCACVHYDGSVKEAARGGAYAHSDGFIYSMYCRVQHDDTLSQRMTFRQIDTMAKALEPFLKDAKAMRLFLSLKDTLDRINAEFLRVCPPEKK